MADILYSSIRRPLATAPDKLRAYQIAKTARDQNLKRIKEDDLNRGQHGNRNLKEDQEQQKKRQQEENLKAFKKLIDDQKDSDQKGNDQKQSESTDVEEVINSPVKSTLENIEHLNRNSNGKLKEKAKGKYKDEEGKIHIDFYA